MIAKGILFALLAVVRGQYNRNDKETGLWDIWTEWSNCTELCGPGTQNRTRNCEDENGSGEEYLLENEGIILECVGGDANSTETRACELKPCAAWTEWGQFGTCSATCGGGNMTRSRECQDDGQTVTDAQVIADNCPGSAVDVDTCNDKKCPEWAEWGEWGTCDAECNGGVRVRTRDCTDAAKHRTYFQTMMLKLMGREDLICDGIDNQEDTCNEQPCSAACGDVNTASFYSQLDVDVRSTIECKSNDYCTLLCIDQGQVPTLQDQSLWDGRIHCNNVSQDWEVETAELQYVCQDLACKNIADFGSAVTIDASVTEKCAENACPLECVDPSYFPQPAASIDCSNWDTYATYLTNHGVECTQSQCGKIEYLSWYSALNSIMSSTCDADACTFTCTGAQGLVPSSANAAWDGIVNCTTASGLWDGAQADGAVCAYLPCVPNMDPAADITQNDNAAINCDGGVCTVTCPNDQYGMPSSFDCSDVDQQGQLSFTSVGCSELSCGKIDAIMATYTVAAGVTTSCNSTADACALNCATGVAFPVTEVTCDGGNPKPAAGTAIGCAATSCGDPADFNYGSGWSDITATCASANECALTCNSGSFPYPVDKVQCDSGVLTPDPSTGAEVYCADSPCGNVADFYDVNNANNDLTSACDAAGCNFTCAGATDMPSYFSVPCVGVNYQHVHDSDKNQISCVTKWDTPCGNVAPTFTFDAQEVVVSCNAFESMYQTDPVTCDVSCNNGKSVVGDSTITCSGYGGSFTNSDKTLKCQDTMCGNVEDKWTLEANTGLAYTCNNGVCTFTCSDATHDPTVDTVTCANGAWETISLFNGLLTDPPIKCAPKTDTYCGDTTDFTNVANNVTFVCDDNTQECNIICDASVYGAEVQANPHKVRCDVTTGNWEESTSTAIKCELFDVTCGNIADHYDLGPLVNSQCVKQRLMRRARMDKCTLTCSEAAKFPYPEELIECNADTGIFVTDNATKFTCEDTKCGDPETWNFGADWSAITKTFDLQGSNMFVMLDCVIGSDAGFVIDDTTSKQAYEKVVCNHDSRVISPAADGKLSLLCADTPCGKLSSNFDIKPNVVSQCDAAGCAFSCADNATMPSYSSIACAASNYVHVHGSDSKAIECVPMQDTPCGNVADHFTYDASAINLNCSSFASIHQQSAHECNPFCTDPATTLVTADAIVCQNGVFTNQEKKIMCKQTACGDVAETFTVAPGVTTTCDASTGVCTFGCTTAGETPNAPTATCKSGAFEDIKLWLGTEYEETNPTIVCEVRDETRCGNAAQFTDAPANLGLSISCDWDSTSCTVQCSPPNAEKNSQPNVEKIMCDPVSKVFKGLENANLHNEQSHNPLPFNFAFKCNRYDVTCGDIESSFNLIGSVNYTCSYWETRSMKADKCVVTCDTPGYIVETNAAAPKPDYSKNEQFEIICNQETKVFHSPPKHSDIKCVPPPETDCGRISDFFTVEGSTGSMSCNGPTCFFICDDPTHHSPLHSVTCMNGNYVPNTQQTRKFECQTGYDTGCGNMEDHILFNSIKSCSANRCVFSCDNKHLYGVQEATCNPGNGTHSFSFVSNSHPQGQTEQSVSQCRDTMCGDLMSLESSNPSLGIQADVIINDTILGTDGYGSILLDCANPADVISGLFGQSAVACLTTGQFDVVNPSGAVRCSDTSCGDVQDALAIGNNIMSKCKDDSCQFTCNVDGSDNAEPSVNTLICQTSTGKFLTGSQKEVKCTVGCDEFGPASGFVIDPLIHQECRDDGQTCDMVCRKRTANGKPVTPTIKETGQPLTKIFCDKPGDRAGVWMSVVHTIYGVPVYQPIKGNGVRHLVCDEDIIIVEEEEKKCPSVRAAYNIDERNMVLRCTPEACIFLCKAGFELTKGAPSMAICKVRHSETWTPPFSGKIECNKVGTKPTDEPETDKPDDCGELDVKKDKQVEQSCSSNECFFSCKNGATPSVSTITCKKGKWDIPKNIKKKGVKCEGGDGDEEEEEEEEGCDEFTAFTDGVVADCSPQACSFSCSDAAQSPNVGSAKCVVKKGKGKWDLGGKKAPNQVECSGGGEDEEEEEEDGCGEPAFDDTVVADCNDQSCTFSCVDPALTPNSLTATCGKKNKWSFDDKKITSVTCNADEEDEDQVPHKCDMNAFDGVMLSDCNDAKVSTCTVSCVGEGLTPDAESVDCKKGNWNLEQIVCA